MNNNSVFKCLNKVYLLSLYNTFCKTIIVMNSENQISMKIKAIFMTQYI